MHSELHPYNTYKTDMWVEITDGPIRMGKGPLSGPLEDPHFTQPDICIFVFVCQVLM